MGIAQILPINVLGEANGQCEECASGAKADTLRQNSPSKANHPNTNDVFILIGNEFAKSNQAPIHEKLNWLSETLVQAKAVALISPHQFSNGNLGAPDYYLDLDRYVVDPFPKFWARRSHGVRRRIREE